MKRTFFVSIILLMAICNADCQVAEMNWKLDYQIFLKMANDSNCTYDIKDVFHIKNTDEVGLTTDFVFYPVNPGEAYTPKNEYKITVNSTYTTLWSALHANLGGGWIHFANCIAYSLETQKLDLANPLMQRPQTTWKPKPVTESWKRTRKWGYYVPIDQKNAIREYKLRLSKNELGDLKNLPDSYIDLFLNTSTKKYRQLKEAGKVALIARIDLVRVIMGANFLGDAQINYISNAVLNSVKSYSAGQLPSVLIFDEFDAAAAMSLNNEGYKVESVVFKMSANLSSEERTLRQKKIFEIIEKINVYNMESFKKRLVTYYKQ